LDILRVEVDQRLQDYLLKDGWQHVVNNKVDFKVFKARMDQNDK